MSNRSATKDADRSSRKGGKVLSGQQARQGDIVLRTPGMRIIFLAGLAGAVLIAVLIRLYFLVA